MVVGMVPRRRARAGFRAVQALQVVLVHKVGLLLGRSPRV